MNRWVMGILSQPVILSALVGTGMSIALLSPLAVSAAELNQQLNVQLNNGTQGASRNEADRLLQLGKDQELDGSLADAVQSWQQALKLYQTLVDRPGEALAYGYLGLAYSRMGRPNEAEDALRRQLAIARDEQDFQGQVYALNSLGRVLAKRGGIQSAASLFNEALAIATNIKSADGAALSHDSLGLLAVSLGNPSRAMEEYT
ncbi:MAG TPA: tetratricopeptide repeat protein, partial [Crinalium sp.]